MLILKRKVKVTNKKLEVNLEKVHNKTNANNVAYLFVYGTLMSNHNRGM